MNISITMESSIEGSKDKLVYSLIDDIERFFTDKDYGQGIQNYYIGLICVEEKFKPFFKLKRPIYKKKKIVELIDGRKVELKAVYSYDLELDYETFMSKSDSDSRGLLANKILLSLSNLDSLSKRVKDFDKEAFKTDMESFFKMINWI